MLKAIIGRLFRDEVTAPLSFKRVIKVFANVVVECSVLPASSLDNDALLTANFVR